MNVLGVIKSEMLQFDTFNKMNAADIFLFLMLMGFVQFTYSIVFDAVGCILGVFMKDAHMQYMCPIIITFFQLIPSLLPFRLLRDEIVSI